MKRFTSLLLVLLLTAAMLPGVTALVAAEDTATYTEEESQIQDESEDVPDIHGDQSEMQQDEAATAEPGTESSVPDEATAAEEAADTEADDVLPAEEAIVTGPAVREETAEKVSREGVLMGAEGNGADASAHFHATITTNRETYTSGETAQVSVKYTIDQETISPGDHVIVTIPPDIASKATFSVSHQHFSSVEDIGNGQYKLIFGENAATGLSGSMTVRVTTRAEEETTSTITVGDGEKAVTVVPAASGETGSGTFANEAIMKDGLGNEGMDYGGYDYSQGEPAQIGLFDSSVDHDFIYRIFVNRKNVSMTNVTVTDNLPDGMYFKEDSKILCYRIDPSTMSRTDEVLSGASISVSGQNLTVYLGDIDYPAEIEYTVHVPAQTSVQFRNHSEITYTQDGNTYKEHKDYIAQGNDYSASNGVKSVDKTIISDDPSDQWVTYTIKFWNDNSFAAGEITLTDDLDDHVKYLYSDDNEYFQLTVDESDPTVLHITNVKDIPASTEVYETFVCDFSGVPVGYTVLNTTGGNTTRTKKISGEASLTAKKTVDGDMPPEGATFNFRLMDQSRRVLQTKSSDGSGNVSFDDIKYGKDDLGKTYVYCISEVINPEDTSYIYDESEYTVTVKVGSAADDKGVIPVSITYEKNGVSVPEAVFNNTKPVVEKTSVSGSKTWNDADNQDGKRPESITVNLYADGTKADSRTVTEEDGWKWSFGNLDKYADGKLIVYSVDEDPVQKYQSSVNGYDITNTYTPGKVSIPVRKVWDDSDNRDGIRPSEITLHLYADGQETGKELVLSEADQWNGTFTDLDEYADGERIAYTIAENEVSGYKCVISGSSDTGYTVTNSHAPETPETPENPDTPEMPDTPEPGTTDTTDTTDTPDTTDTTDTHQASASDVPRTGDNSHMELWFSLMFSSLGILLLFAYLKDRDSSAR